MEALILKRVWRKRYSMNKGAEITSLSFLFLVSPGLEAQNIFRACIGTECVLGKVVSATINEVL
jgi:hypothetical protein